MPNTNLYCKTTGSNLNGGGIASGAEPTDAAIATYTSIVAANGWNAATGVFTVAAGNPVTDGVTVGDWASVYVTAGATVAVFSGRVTARDATTVTVSLTVKSGTPPATDATGATTMKVGGAWAGPNGTTMFPLTFVQNTMTPTASVFPRIRMLNSGGDYLVTAAATMSNAGPIVWQGLRAVLTGVTASAATDIITKVAHGYVTGDVVVMDSGTGFTGILAEREYYAIRIDADTFRVAASYNLALAGTYIDITVDGSNGAFSAPAHATITGDDATQPFILLTVSATRHEFQYLEFSNNGFNAGPVAGGDHMIQCTSGGTSLRFYRCLLTNSYRGGLLNGGPGAEVFECEGYGCNRNANNQSGVFAASSNTEYTRCWAHHNGLVPGDNGNADFVMNAGTGLRLSYFQCIGSDGGGQGWLNHTGNCLADLHGCVICNHVSSGMELVGNVGSVISIENTIFINNNTGAEGTGAAIRFQNAGFGVNGRSNAFFNNGANKYVNGLPYMMQDDIDLSGDPFVDSADGNFALNNTAGAGAACRGFGATRFYNSAGAEYTEITQSFPDVGAAQHEEVPFVAPDPYDVRLGVDNGNGEPGTLTSPAEADVEVGVQYGGDGTEFTGTVVLPAAADVLAGTAYGPGDSLTGTLECGGGGGSCLPSCVCVREMPVNQKLDAIYCVLAELANQD